MMVVDLLIISIQNAIQITGEEESLGEVTFYLFGSSTFAYIVNDIDILIIYNSDVIHPINIINLKKQIYHEIMKNFKVKTDFLTFTVEEARNYRIVKRVKGKRIKYI